MNSHLDKRPRNHRRDLDNEGAGTDVLDALADIQACLEKYESLFSGYPVDWYQNLRISSR